MTWLRRNLFHTPAHSALTLVFGSIAAFAVIRLFRFVFVTGRWEIIRHNLTTLLVGLFPTGELWRVWLAMYLLGIGVAAAAGAIRARALVHGAERLPRHSPLRRAWAILLLIAVMLVLRPSVVSAALAGGVLLSAFTAFRSGQLLGARRFRATAGSGVAMGVAAYAVIVGGGIRVERWGGLMLTFALAATSIALSFPAGVLLALGRRSTLPAVRIVCTAYIELIRGVPLLTVLFMASLVVGFLLPPGADRPSVVTRAIIAFVAFTAAYIAEIVRGGLEAVGRAQVDAAAAVGLGTVSSLRLVVLPQALRAVIPGLVGQFITLFKDTSLVTIIGLTELLRRSQVLTRDPEFLAQGLHAETLAFASFIYWTISFTMSRESQRLESRLGVGTR